MPSLETVIRRHHIGSDDLAIPAIIEIIAYSLWLIWSWQLKRLDDSCFRDYHLLRNFHYIEMILMGCSLLLATQILQTSVQGTVINTRPRCKMGRLILFKLVLDMVVLGFIFLATAMAVFGDFSRCSLDSKRALWWHIGMSWTIGLLVAINTWHWAVPPLAVLSSIKLDFLTCFLSTDNKQRLWNYLGFDDHSVLNRIAELLITFFKERINLVPTDLLVSLILLEKEQKHQLEVPPNDISVERKPWMNVNLAKHYLHFASSLVGRPAWPMLLFRGPLAIFRLCKFIITNGRKDDIPQNIVGDDRWLSNTSLIRYFTGLSLQELVYVSFHNRLFEVPFYVAIDHTHKSVVVCIRGSFSHHDVLTDLMAFESEKFSFDDLPDASAHVGMLTAAKKLLCKLLGTDGVNSEEGLLLKAKRQLEDIVGEEAAKTYKLTVTGYSLGAGVAAILSMFLYQKKEYQDLQCFAFAPPGGLLSQSAATYSERFVFSLIFGDDLIGRLGIYTFFDLKLKVLNILKNCDIPKHAIIGGWLHEKVISIFSRSNKHGDNDRFNNSSPTWTNDALAARDVAHYQRHLEEAIESTICERDKHSHLFLPGCILHITDNSTNARWWFRRKRTFQMRYCRHDADVLTEIIVSPKVLLDHRPSSMIKALVSVDEE